MLSLFYLLAIMDMLCFLSDGITNIIFSLIGMKAFDFVRFEKLGKKLQAERVTYLLQTYRCITA